MKYDLIIIGAGIVGLSTAYEYIKKYPNKELLILEKESDIALHQTGNNSGVLHSGIYYKPRSLKAINCQSGYKKMIEFCQEYNLPYDICGKIIVATEKKELNVLDEIYKRGVENGLSNIKYLKSEQIKDYEPHCKGLKAIHVPQAGIINYKEVSKKIFELLILNGVDISFNQEVKNIKNDNNLVNIETRNKTYITKKLICCGGLHSDRLSDKTNKEKDLRILPFRGEYYEIKKESENLVNNLIYPVPDPAFPFLGVHFTRMIEGGIEAGPNAVLAFKREGYKFTDFNINDFKDIIFWPGFWKIALKYGKIGAYEMYRSFSKKAFTRALQKLVPEIKESDLVKGGAGVRAQVCDKKGVLIDDFYIKNNKNIVNVINAPSPAATSAFSIGESIINKI
ncbi:L-2-hydroxyglutarate oxidase [Flavobacteriaceae bacterium]|nr:L-2-hydroxyglutarate oxidase [Flavobacteriaceae bacterium]